VTLHDALARASRDWRRARALGGFAPAALAGIAFLALAAWTSIAGLGLAAAIILLGWTLLAGCALFGALRARREWAALDRGAIAHQIERDGGARAGAIRTLLDHPAPGTSSTLHAAALAQQVEWVETHGQGVLAARTTAARHRNRRWLLATGGALAALVLARPLGGAPALVWQPWQAWSALTAPVRLEADRDTVGRGEAVTFRIAAFGQQRAVLLTRSPGETWQETEVALDPDGRAEVQSGPLVTEVVAKVRAGGRDSREVRIGIRLPAFLGSFTLTAVYPQYLGLESEVLPSDGDTLVVPEGTRLQVSGQATTPLANAAFRSAGHEAPFEVDRERFTGTVTPTETATWQLDVSPLHGGTLEGVPSAIVIRVVADSAPAVTMPLPGNDTIASPTMQLPVMVAIEDDHGIRNARIEMRRGRTGRLEQVALPLGAELVDRALLSHTIDLDAHGLVPGDTLFYSAAATDNAPRGQVGRSREFTLRIPTEAEQRAAQTAATAETASGLDSLAAAARQAQRQTEDLARERDRGAQSGQTGSGEPMSSEAARRAEQAAEQQQRIEEQLAEMSRQLAQLEQTAERQGVADSTLATQMAEIRELLDRAMTPELRQAMQELRQALQELDADRARSALRDLAQQQDRMRQAIERARELFERAAMETELANLAETARELMEEQQRAAERLATDSAGGARAEEALAARADSLASALDQSAEQVPSERTEEGLRESAEAAREAASQMRNAAQSARQGQRQRAQQQAQAAGEALAPVEKQIREERENLQEEMKEEVIAALDRLLAETSRLLSRQHAVADAFRRGALAGPLRAEESMLEESTGKLLEQVIDVSGMNALISPRIGVALAGARDGMRAAIEATSSVSPSLGTATDRAGEAVDYLALAAYSLLRSRESVENAESGSGLAEAMQQMQQAAGAQGELSDQGQSMLSQGGQPEMSEMMQLAMQQRAIAQQLERMRAQGQMPGAGELGREARELARALEQGRLSAETVERQQRLFRRMLDAGRSLEGEERDDQKERQGESATEGERSRPGALDPRLLRGPEFPLPSWEELQRLSPDDRRRVLDYFRRLTEAPPR
jgi:hypothetical protein